MIAVARKGENLTIPPYNKTEAYKEMRDLIAKCGTRYAHGQIPPEVVILQWFLFGDAYCRKELFFRMIKDIGTSSLSTYIAGLAFVERSANGYLDSGNWTQTDASTFLRETEHLVTFLERSDEGTAGERGLAYALLGGLLRTRRSVRTPSPMHSSTHQPKNDPRLCPALRRHCTWCMGPVTNSVWH